MSTHRTWAVRAAAAVVAFLLTGALAACGSASAQDDEPHAQEAASSQSPVAGDSGDAPAETQGEEQSLAATLLFNGPSHTDTAAPGAWGESGCDAQKQARIIVVRGTEEPAGQSLMSPLASRIAAELGDHAQVSDLDYPASWESGSEAAGVNRLIAVLNAQSAQCPAMRTVLLGYSQGAMVVGDALSAPDTRFNEDNGYELSPVARGHIVRSTASSGQGERRISVRSPTAPSASARRVTSRAKWAATPNRTAAMPRTACSTKA